MNIPDSKYGVLDTESALICTISPDNRFAWSKIFDKDLELFGNKPLPSKQVALFARQFWE